MSLRHTLIVSLLVGLVSVSPALAATKGGSSSTTTSSSKTSSTKATSSTSTASSSIKTTGIEAFDKIFTQVAEIDSRLKTIESTRKSAHQQVNAALDLSKKTSLSDALEELKDRAGDKIELAWNGKTPTLTLSDAVPSDVQATVDALNAAMADYKTAADELTTLPSDCKNLYKQMKKFPSRIQEEAGKVTLDNLDTRWKQAKKVRKNIKTTSKIPDRAETVAEGISEDIQLVATAFDASPKKSGSGKSSTGSSSSGKSKGKSK